MLAAGTREVARRQGDPECRRDRAARRSDCRVAPGAYQGALARSDQDRVAGSRGVAESDMGPMLIGGLGGAIIAVIPVCVLPVKIDGPAEQRKRKICDVQ